MSNASKLHAVELDEYGKYFYPFPYTAGVELAGVMAPPLAPRHPWRSPRWLYHLALAEEWQQAQAEGLYRRSTRGLSLEQVGFLHASYPHQIAATFERFYADAGPVRLLSIDPQRLAAAGQIGRAHV